MLQIDEKTTSEQQPENPEVAPKQQQHEVTTESDGCFYLLVTTIGFWLTIYILAITFL